MRNWRTLVGALCLVVAMMLGAFAGLVYGGPGGVGVSPSAGTRGEDRRLASAFDEAQKALSPTEAQQVDQSATPKVESLLESDAIELISPDGATAKPVSQDEMRDAMMQGAQHVFESQDGTITVQPTQPGTRSHLVGGEIDAGGPYGGPDTFEGGPALTFTVTSNDPTIIFFRWDFNGDGIYDYPDQTGASSLGFWTTQTTVSKQFFDNFYGNIVVQGWDGVSTTILINNGDNLNQGTTFQWFIGFGGWNFAWQFRAKKDMTVTQLGHYHYVYTLFDQALWTDTGSKLGSCMPVHSTFTWNWCTLGSPVTLTTGSTYRISIRISTWTTAINSPSDTAQVQFQGTYYCFSPSVLCFPSTFWTATFIPLIDFRWQTITILPDAAQDVALLQIKNVAPTVFGVRTSPSPGLEGTAVKFTADFTDPGLDDTWEYRWAFPDGTTSPWLGVSKYSGGAKVLILHSWTGDIGGIKTSVKTACGTFCTTVDDMDFGPLGQNRIPTLAELTKYDVLVVGTNWGPIPNSAQMGDRIAEYMDAAGATGGGVVMMDFGFYSNTIWGIGGRWETEKSPLPRAGTAFFTANLGTIYVPGHPFLDGVAAINAFYRQNIFSVNSGATRVADWTDGRVLAALKADSGGRLACGLNYFPALNVGGDYARVIANAIRFCSRQADPVLKTMPIALDPFSKIYPDDDPTTTTPIDTVGVARVEVRDDDHDKIEVQSSTPLGYQDFSTVSQCTPGGAYYLFQTFPPGWSSSPNPYGWACGSNAYGQGRSPFILYYFNDPLYGTGQGTSNLVMPTLDLSPFVGIQVDFYQYWQADYPSGNQAGYIQASFDGGATWPVTLFEQHHNAPASDRGTKTVQNVAVGGQSSVRLRFQYVSDDDWWWAVDNIRLTGIVGEVINGLGSSSGEFQIANVPPTVIGGFDSALRDEAQSQAFKGFTISDPALIQPTESFWYAWNFDDGSPVTWVYKGSLAPPKLKVLLIHTLVLSGCSSYCANLRNTLLAQDDVASVDTFNFIQFPPSAPSLSTMLQYDAVVVATNWAYISYPPFDLARRQVGDRLAQYIDAGRGGVLTMMAIYDLSSFYGDIFSINGRYMDDKYGPFLRTEYGFSPGAGINILDPESDLFVGVNGNVDSAFISPGNMPLSIGGNGNAAGQNGVKLATWKNTGNPAVGAKTLLNGIRTVHIGAFGDPRGADIGQLLRNSVGFASVNGLPSPKIPAFSHTWGDNGVYTVDILVQDDDMGYVFDTAANQPVQILSGTGVGFAHRYVTISVNNVEPTIVAGSIQAFIAAQVCVRISGSGGNSVTASFYTDGVLSSSTTVTRQSGSPNPTDEKCGLLKVDVLAAHDFSATLTYSAPAGGSNPTWLVIAPWREPVSPGHGTVTYKFDFAAAGTQTLALPTLKTDLMAGGQGAKVDFVAEAQDPGTDDLAFLWTWGTVAGTPYLIPNLATDVYTIHVHHNDGTATTAGALSDPQHLGYGEAFFDRTANTGRTPLGPTNLRIRDSSVHAFDMQQNVYYVVVIVMDDDVARGYPSLQNFALDGVDMEFVVVDLR